MRVHWFSPLPPARTDIANYTRRILRPLAAQAKVTLWTDAHEVPSDLKAHATIRQWDDGPNWSELNRADAVFYNFGNDGRFHSWILDTARAHPGIAILHDTNLHEFLAYYFRVRLNGPGEYVRLLERYHGSQAREDGIQVIAGPREAHELAPLYPLTNYFIELANGVVVHNPEAARPLAEQARRPVLSLPLPYGSENEIREPRLYSPRREHEPRHIILFGFLHGENRRLIPFLEAFARLPDQTRFTLTLAGEYPNEGAIRTHLKRLSIKAPCRMLGFLDESTLSTELDRADLAINLRYPTRGEASGSQLRIWNHSLSSLVTRSGYYATLPTDAVAFVRPEHEASDIINHLEALASDPARYREMGLRGHSYLKTYHTSERYVERLLDFAKTVQDSKAAGSLERTALSIADRHLASLPDAYLQRHIASVLARQAHRIASHPNPAQAQAIPNDRT